MSFIIRSALFNEPILASFETKNILNNPYMRINYILGEKWKIFTKTRNFLQIIYGNLSKYLYEHVIINDTNLYNSVIDLELSTYERNIILVYVDGFMWCELEIRNHGFDIRGEPIEPIYLIDVMSYNIAW